jgi:hypothetical protein
MQHRNNNANGNRVRMNLYCQIFHFCVSWISVDSLQSCAYLGSMGNVILKKLNPRGVQGPEAQ